MVENQSKRTIQKLKGVPVISLQNKLSERVANEILIHLKKKIIKIEAFLRILQTFKLGI